MALVSDYLTRAIAAQIYSTVSAVAQTQRLCRQECVWQWLHMEVFISSLSAGSWTHLITAPTILLSLYSLPVVKRYFLPFKRFKKRTTPCVFSHLSGCVREIVVTCEQYKPLITAFVIMFVGGKHKLFAFKYTVEIPCYRLNRPWNAVSLKQHLCFVIALKSYICTCALSSFYFAKELSFLPN